MGADSSSLKPIMRRRLRRRPHEPGWQGDRQPEHPVTLGQSSTVAWAEHDARRQRYVGRARIHTPGIDPVTAPSRPARRVGAPCASDTARRRSAAFDQASVWPMMRTAG